MREFCHPGQEGEEETMVRALEARLAEVSEEKDPLPLVRPLLDAMDARWGAVPFDLDAGWKALEQRPVRRRRRFPLILAAVLTALCLLACGAAVVVLSRPGAADVPVQEDELYPSLEEFFRMEDAQTGLVMPSTHSPEVSAQVGSLTVRVLQTVQDTMTFYVLFSLELPEDEVFPEDVSSLSTHIIGTDPIDASTGAGTGYSQIVEQSPHRLVVLHYLTGSGMEDMEGPVKLWFPVDVKVWYNEDKYYKIFSRKPLVLRWQAPSVQAVRTWTPDAPMQDGELTLSKVQLSPLSVSFTLDGTDIVAAPVPVTLTFQDGTVWEVPEHAQEMVEDMSSTFNDGSGRMRHVYDYRFDRPIDLETGAGVRVGEVELS